MFLHSLTVVSLVILGASIVARAEQDDSDWAKAREAQGKIDALSDELVRKLSSLEVEYNNKKTPVFAERNHLLQGKKGFWAKTIGNHPSHTLWFHNDDKDVLQHLRDITVSDVGAEEAEHGRSHEFRVSMTFEPNPFFSDSVLFREFKHNHYEDEASPDKVSGIKWLPGKQPNDISFWNFFETKREERFMEQHMFIDIGHVIRYELWPNPFTYHDLPSYDDYVAATQGEDDGGNWNPDEQHEEGGGAPGDEGGDQPFHSEVESEDVSTVVDVGGASEEEDTGAADAGTAPPAAAPDAAAANEKGL